MGLSPLTALPAVPDLNDPANFNADALTFFGAFPTFRTELMNVTDMDGVTIGSTTPAPATVSSLNGGQIAGDRNLIINGDMRIAQENGATSVTPANGDYPIDRWRTELVVAGKYAVQQVSDAPPGFSNSLLVTSLSAHTIVSGDQFNLRHGIEGVNCSHLAWGTADAKAVSVSFWVKSNITGTFGASLSNRSNNRLYNFDFTISTADTWQYVHHTLDGPTSGSWDTESQAGIFLRVNLGLGTTFGTSNTGVWETASNKVGKTGSGSLVATNGATLNLTGVQLELGKASTPFEHVDFSESLRRCQRYYEQNESSFSNCVYSGYAESGVIQYATATFKVTKRAAPSITLTSTNANRFPTSSGAAADINIDGFNEGRTATSTGAGALFSSGFKARSEI